MTEDKDERILKLITSSESDGNIANVFNAVAEEKLKLELSKSTENALVQEAAFALMRRWFPNRLPTGDDYKKWIEISLEDAEAVIEHFINSGIIVGEIKDDSN